MAVGPRRERGAARAEHARRSWRCATCSGGSRGCPPPKLLIFAREIPEKWPFLEAPFRFWIGSDCPFDCFDEAWSTVGQPVVDQRPRYLGPGSGPRSGPRSSPRSNCLYPCALCSFSRRRCALGRESHPPLYTSTRLGRHGILRERKKHRLTCGESHASVSETPKIHNTS